MLILDLQFDYLSWMIEENDARPSGQREEEERKGQDEGAGEEGEDGEGSGLEAEGRGRVYEETRRKDAHYCQ